MYITPCTLEACNKDLLYYHYYKDLVIITESLEVLQEKLILWKTNIEGKGLQVNTGKSKVPISGPGLNVLQKSGKDPYGVCLKGVCTNFIFCGGFSTWIHKKCSGVPGSLKTDASYRCKQCTGQARPIDGKLMTEVRVAREKLEVVPSFCYLGTAYPQVAVVNLLPLQDAVSHGVNSISSCPYSPPSHFPSPQDKEFTICVSGVPCSMQARPGPQSYLICIACNTMTELWFAGCAVSPPKTKSACRISWRGCSLKIWQRYSSPGDSEGIAM